jgi:crossover junction endodeoxyribonuclease RuvC
MSKSHFIVGIDPGTHGAVAFLSVTENGHATLATHDIPINHVVGSTRVFNLVDAERLTELLRGRAIDEVWLERVHSMPEEGAVGAFSFGENFGTIKGVCGALGLTVNLVEPSVWKAALNVPAEKALSKARAFELFPLCVKLFRRVDKAEASMIALYGALFSGWRFAGKIKPSVAEMAS